MFDIANFEAKLKAFLAGVEKIVGDHYERHLKNLAKPSWSYDVGNRYVRVVRHDPHKSVFAFVDRRNGDVLKPASWKAPAKHARGNIYDAANGLGAIGPYGPAYLK